LRLFSFGGYGLALAALALAALALVTATLLNAAQMAEFVGKDGCFLPDSPSESKEMQPSNTSWEIER